MPGADQFGIDEGEVELGVVGDHRILADKVEELARDHREGRLVAKPGVVEAVNTDGLCGHGPLGIDVDVKCLPGRDVIDQFDAADLDDTVAAVRIKAGGFGIEDDFAHDSDKWWRSRVASASPRPGSSQGRRQSPAHGSLRADHAGDGAKDVVDLAFGVDQAPAGVDDEMGAPPLLAIGHLAGEHRVHARLGHSRPRAEALALDRFRGAGYDDEVWFGPRRRLRKGVGYRGRRRGGRASSRRAERLFPGKHQRVDQGLEPTNRLGIADHAVAEAIAIDGTAEVVPGKAASTRRAASAR